MKKILFCLLLFTFLIPVVSYCSTNSVLDRAITLYQWKYYNESIVELNKLILDGKEPWAGRASYLKAHCLWKKGNIELAKDLFRSLSLSPDFALYDYAKFSLAQIYFDSKDYERAYKEYKEFYTDSALKPQADLKRAECLYLMGKYNEAMVVCEELIAEGLPGAPLDKARFNLGRYYEKTGNVKAAMRTYHDLNLYHPLSPVLREGLARIKYLSRKYKIHPDEAKAEDVFNRALVFYNFGDFGSASIIFGKIVTNYKKSALWEDALYYQAMSDYKRKRLTSSINKFKLCISNGGDKADDAQFYLSFAYGKLGYFYQALDCLNKVTLNYANSEYADDAAYWTAYYYEVNGFKDAAIQYYKSFVNRFPKSEFLDDAYWKLGHVYYFNKDYANAKEMFKKAVETSTDTSMLDACTYWLGLTNEKLNNRSDAIAAYQTVISKYDHTYYSHRAREKLISWNIETDDYIEELADSPIIGETNTADIPVVEEEFPFEGSYIGSNTSGQSTTSNKITNIKDHFRKYSELMAIGFYDEAMTEATVLIECSPEDKKTSARLALASAQLASGKVRESIVYAENICNKAIANGSYRQLPLQSWQLAYPKGFYKHVQEYSRQFGIEEPLVLAVIREESRFNPNTLSWANARGLMQIIPQTGRNVARLVGIRSYTTGKLYDPETNIKMGCYYLSQLLKRFDGNKIYALSAYNGGPLRTKKWITKWKSAVGENIDMDEFVESIPLSETRRYVQKVLKSYYEYKRLYSNKYPLIKVKS